MLHRLPVVLALAGAVACGAGAGPVVVAPASPAAPGDAPPAARTPAARKASPGGPAACGQSWSLEDAIGGAARVLVICGSDLRREPVTIGAMTRALDPALSVAHERVCACAARLPAPAFVDLVVTALPDDGASSVEPAEPDGAVDPEAAAAFAACVGRAAVPFPAFHADACGGPGRAKYVYSLDVELAP